MQALRKSAPGAECPKGLADVAQQGAWPSGCPTLARLKRCGIEELPFTAAGPSPWLNPAGLRQGRVGSISPSSAPALSVLSTERRGSGCRLFACATTPSPPMPPSSSG